MAEKIVILGDKQSEESKAKAEMARQLSTEQKVVLRREENQEKEKLLEREAENYTRIMALKCHDGWLKLYDNSAIIVSTWLGGKLDKTYVRKDDGGYGKPKAKYGVVSIPPVSVGSFVQALARVGIKLIYDDAWVLDFELRERIEKADMVRMLHEDELLIEKVNKLVMPKEVMPGLRMTVKLLLNFVHAEVRSHKESMKDVFLNEVERLAVDMNRMVIATSRGNMKTDKCLAEIAESTERMYENATTMCDMGLLSAGSYKRFVDLIIGVQKEQARMVRRKALIEAEAKNDKNKKR